MDTLSLTINFQSTEELQDFLKQIKPKEKKVKKEGDKRGSQTKSLHNLAKEYIEEKKDTPYKLALKIAGEKLKARDILHTV